VPRPPTVPAGHRALPHTADLALEAWAPSEAECIAHAARALVESFADTRGAVPGESVTVAFDEETREGLLVAILDEVIYQLDAHSRLPADIGVELTPAAGTRRHARMRFAAVPAGEAALVGAIPKAVSLHGLRFTHDGGRWCCHVTVDT
jgi:SHS2 domain-containing protein